MRAQPHRVTSQRASPPVGVFPHARRVGISCSSRASAPRVRGQPPDIPGVTLDAQGNVTDHDIAMQCKSVSRTSTRHPRGRGDHLDRLVDVTVFLTDMENDCGLQLAGAEYFEELQPCRTTVEVTRLPTPIAIELKCIATMPE